MNTFNLRLLTAAATVAALSACEGEPPKYPTNPSPPPPAQVTETTAAEPANAPTATQPAPAQPPAATAGSGCNCPCMCGRMHEEMHGQPAPSGPAAEGGATPAPGTGTATAAAATTPPESAAVAAPAPAAHANIVGTVTTVPARAAGSAVVYLEDAPIVPNRGSSAAIDNRGMSFIPFVTVVVAGGRVVFKNSDPFPHNVFSPDKDKFNLGMVQPASASTHVFKSPGAYSLLCNLHPNMLGYVVVSPSSYFARANAKGQFTIKDVPAGTYKITAWAPRLQTVTESITVKDTDATADFTLHR